MPDWSCFLTSFLLCKQRNEKQAHSAVKLKVPELLNRQFEQALATSRHAPRW
jgi:hypothetical protein